jgi:SPP1 gp7 family putative phage head morphogenesis protein
VALRIHHDVGIDSGTRERLGGLLARHLASADVLGRMQILRHARAKTGKVLPLATSTRIVAFAEGDDPTAGFSFDVGGADWAEYLRNLTPVTREIFDGLTAQYRRDAFTIAGAADQRLVAKIQEALAQTAARGGTPAEFRASANKLTSEAGVADLNAFTLDTAFQTAMQKAYSAGRLRQMQEPHMLEALPYWQYWTVGDTRVRPEHAVLDGFLARAIDPVWTRIYPPSGYNCRCSVVPIPEDEALKLDPDAEHGGIERLPMLAALSVPTPGFRTLAHP